jgi:hypothetical protein
MALERKYVPPLGELFDTAESEKGPDSSDPSSSTFSLSGGFTMMPQLPNYSTTEPSIPPGESTSPSDN